MKKYLFGFLVFAIFVLAGCSSATNSNDSGAAIETEFQYITAEELKTKITGSEPLLLIDVRSQEDYDLKHMKESVATGAYPIDTDEKKEKVMAVMDQFKGNTDPIIFLCYKGKTSAENGFKLLKEKGYDAERLFILEGGMNAWPYDDFLETSK